MPQKTPDDDVLCEGAALDLLPEEVPHPLPELISSQRLSHIDIEPVALVEVAVALNNRGIRTARGGQWYPMTVRNIEARGRL